MWQPAHTRAFTWRFDSPSGDGAAAWRREQPAPARATSRAAAVASFRGKARGTSPIFAPSYAPLNGFGPRPFGNRVRADLRLLLQDSSLNRVVAYAHGSCEKC